MTNPADWKTALNEHPSRLADHGITSGASGLGGAKPHHEPQLDGVRGIAILAVLLSHSVTVIAALPNSKTTQVILSMLTPGWGGVDLFFALSGFLITGILLRGKAAPTYFKSFYMRRVLRIFPVYYLFLIGTLIVSTQIPYIAARLPLTTAHLPRTTGFRLSYFLYLQNVPFFWPNITVGLTGVWGAYWSLAVEEQFYFVWPALVRYVRLERLYWFCIAGIVAAPFARGFIARYTGEGIGLLQFPISRLDGLLAGSALALYRERKGKALSLAWAACWATVGTSFLAFIASFHPDELLGTNFWDDRIAVSGFALLALGIIAATQHVLPPLIRVLTLRPLLSLGKYSYGIYVYHLFIFFLFRHFRYLLGRSTSHIAVFRAICYDLLAISLVFVVAQGSFKYIEKPFLSMKRFFPSPAD